MYSRSAHDVIVNELQAKIMTLHKSIWERRAAWPQVIKWLEQFDEDADPAADEQLHALRLLSNFMYFGVNEIRALLRSLYRDTFRPQVAKEVRTRLGASVDFTAIARQVHSDLDRTRFVSLGNPSESSALLLYYFRQENSLPKDLFIHASDIFDLSSVGMSGSVSLRDPTISRYVFIDDLCGSGHQAEEYAKNIVAPLKRIDAAIRTYYYPLFGLSTGIEYLRGCTEFDLVAPVMELDDSFRAFAPESRLFVDETLALLRPAIEATCRRYGDQLLPGHPLGYDDGQLFIGFAHNTPDNSLPIFWSDNTAPLPWLPIFRRYPKVFW
ncbi:phosphoribosyltransferase-like protein [Novosphingobium sp. MBES04]|uniref:phosphoribosyltransferase-like protein n=1 Tax=Novosphingobium sp. MBES04 TaxID=1206458 RepID=UPI00057DE44B|nr:hypothetical protein [Novosphingobium sp. MBES04]